MCESFWANYENLEIDFQKVLKYIHPVNSHNGVYSLEIYKLLLEIGSEVDSAAEELIKLRLDQIPDNSLKAQIQDKINNNNFFDMSDYKKVLTTSRFNFHNKEVIFNAMNISLTPFNSWTSNGGGKAPIWWHSFTGLKHNRARNLTNAALSQAYEALAGLFIILLFLRQDEIEKDREAYILIKKRKYSNFFHPKFLQLQGGNTRTYKFII